MKLPVYKNCDGCGKYKRVEQTHDVGDKVNFTKVTGSGNNIKVRSYVGTISAIDGDKVTVKHRGFEVFRTPSKLTSTLGASGLAASLMGLCECED